MQAVFIKMTGGFSRVLSGKLLIGGHRFKRQKRFVLSFFCKIKSIWEANNISLSGSWLTQFIATTYWCEDCLHYSNTKIFQQYIALI